MNLFLDDIRNPYDVFLNTIDPPYMEDSNWHIVRDYDRFILFIESNEMPDLISFDHDLDQSHYLPKNQKNIDYNSMKIKCGFHCLDWLILHCKSNKLPLPQINIHSQNLEGKKNMETLISKNVVD
jgi:hypothetical protein